MNEQVNPTTRPLPSADVHPYDGGGNGASSDYSPEALRAFVEGDLRGNVDDFSGHTEGLNWRVNNLGIAMSDEQREQAMEDFVNQAEAENPGWQATLEDYQAQVQADGARLLQWLGRPEITSLPLAEREALLNELILSEDNPEARVAILTALGVDGAASANDIDAALGFFEGVDLIGASPEFAGQLAQARLQRVNDVLQAVDPSDPSTIRAAELAIEDLRSSPYASMLDIPEPEFDVYLDALRETVPQPGVTWSEAEVTQRIEALKTAADDIDTATGDPTLSNGLRLLGLGTGAIGLVAAGSDLFSDPNPETALRALTELLGIGNETADLLVTAGINNRVVTTFAHPGLGKVLGAAGLVFGLVDLARYARDGDWMQASLAGAGMAGTAMALGLFGSAAWMGPVGIAIGVIAAAGSLGLNQWRRVDASNEFMDDTSRDFLMNAGLSADAANALVDQSGEGYSPVPFLFAYADSQGLDREQTITWLNSLDANDMESIRDRAHEVLDNVNGDFSNFDASTDAGVIEYLEGFRQASAEGGNTWHQGSGFSINDEYRDVVAGSWDEFSALLSAKGLSVATPPLELDGGPVDLEVATRIALENFDTFRGDGDSITVDDLIRVRDDASLAPELRLAAEFLVNSRVSRYFLDVGQAKGGVDGHISEKDLRGALDTITSGHDYVDELLDTASGRDGRDGNIGDADISAASVDPGIPLEYRERIQEMLRN